VIAGLKGDVTGAAEETLTGMLFGDVEGDDFSVVNEVVLMPAFANNLAGAIEDDAADGGVGRGDGDAAAGKFEGALHPVAILFGGGHECARGRFKFTLPPAENQLIAAG
jgi:hypothetical protein